MFLVSNVLLGMANARLNNLLSDELDNYKLACVINLHKMWQKCKSATSGMQVGSMLTQHCVNDPVRTNAVSTSSRRWMQICRFDL